ncbi:MAG TPA: hypothetical protein VLL54_17150 [Pyrinomonadaceae bacterium]|nr:hypothetical protein [Pyrinomonadaceae bacterium]
MTLFGDAFVELNYRRRFIVGLLLALFCGTVGSLSGHASQKFNEVSLRVRGVGLGSSQAAVLRRFGKPLSRKQETITDETCSPRHTDLTLTYEGMTFKLEGDVRDRKFEVVSIELTSKKVVISPKIEIGFTEKQVRIRLGAPNEAQDEPGLRKLFYVTKGNDGSAVLSFERGKLVKVYWQYTLC